MLAIPAPEGVWSLRTDASKFTLGAVLMQETQQDGERVIGYYSKKLKNMKTRYPIYDRELLGVKEAILYFRYFLHGNQFMVYTDHASIQHIL